MIGFSSAGSIAPEDPPIHIFRWGGNVGIWGTNYLGPGSATYYQVNPDTGWQNRNVWDGWRHCSIWTGPFTVGPTWSPCGYAYSHSTECDPYVYGCLDNGSQDSAGGDQMDSLIPGVVADNLGTVSGNYNFNWPVNAGPANTVNSTSAQPPAAVGGFVGCFYTIQACLDVNASNYMRGVWDQWGSFVTGSIDTDIQMIDGTHLTVLPCTNTVGGGVNDCCYYSAGCTYNASVGVFESMDPITQATIDSDHTGNPMGPPITVGPYAMGGPINYEDIYPSLANLAPGPLYWCDGVTPYIPINAAPGAYQIDDGSCTISIPGCMNSGHIMYCAWANYDTGCPDPLPGCTDILALNYCPPCNQDCAGNIPFTDFSCCDFPIMGCMDPLATNYQFDCAGTNVGQPDVDDGCCEYAGVGQGCPDPAAINYGGPAVLGCGSPPNPNDTSCCVYPAYGCTDPLATNYDPLAIIDDGTCIYPEMEVPVGLNPYNGHEIELCMSAITKEEVLINVCQEVEIQSELFINRGKQSVFESSQRMGEIETIGGLEIYGYGFYQINKELTKSTKWH